MTSFTYKARTKDGSIDSGTVEAKSRADVVSQLRQEGKNPLSVQEHKGSIEINVPFLDKMLHGIKLKDKLIMVKNLSGMLRSGLALYRAMSVLEKQAKKKPLKDIYQSLMEDIQSGETLSSGLEKFPKVFSPLFVSMVRSGEESGGLPDALDTIHVYLEKTYNLNRKIKGAMIYPGVIMSVMVSIGILMMIFVVPTLVGLFEDLETELPKSTQAIINVSNGFENHPLLIIGGIIAVVTLMVFLLKSPKLKPYIDWTVLRLPAVGSMAKQINTARTARTLASLLDAGVSLTRALEITHEVVQNKYYKDVLSQASKDVVKGVQLSAVIRKYPDRYPVMATEMIEVGEETGKVSKMLMDIAIFYEEEVENKTKDLSTIIEPVLMVVIGAGVGVFAVSMIKPMYSVLESF